MFLSWSYMFGAWFYMLPPKKRGVWDRPLYLQYYETYSNFQGIFPSPYLAMLGFYPPWAAAQLLAQFWQTTWDEKSWPRFCYSNGIHGESQNKWRLQLRVPIVWASIWEQENLMAFTTGDANNHPTNSDRKSNDNKIKIIKTKIYAKIQVKQKLFLKFERWSFPSIWNTPKTRHFRVLVKCWAFDGQCGSKF